MKAKWIGEFQEFVARGNALDMAVGVLVGTAFNKVVDSLVNDVIMPPLGFVIGGVDFKNLQLVLKTATAGGAPVTIRYGQFINSVLQFFVVALTMFVVIKTVGKMAEWRAGLEKIQRSFPPLPSQAGQQGPAAPPLENPPTR
ncbi:large conductance mechanosensitive channel protein MscL [Candidatus Methylacidithermus pantelleriae]|uniref:Large-conductance mechanosensitive channel n=1 Tax=Candidatus Methylacidithermus pantelleriae TaxID=2744239 RepID=A0A8J2FVA6_9BACT|nr:large conductance mechanosensitive channel protein MscL [Candidatus Methylacidithermus pantelleriae]CAF0691907.1 Large-conductance mechanosensitive channel [Candidatus Methylacidithermus pantelleriae]